MSIINESNTDISQNPAQEEITTVVSASRPTALAMMQTGLPLQWPVANSVIEQEPKSIVQHVMIIDSLLDIDAVRENMTELTFEIITTVLGRTTMSPEYLAYSYDEASERHGVSIIENEKVVRTAWIKDNEPGECNTAVDFSTETIVYKNGIDKQTGTIHDAKVGSVDIQFESIFENMPKCCINYAKGFLVIDGKTTNEIFFMNDTQSESAKEMKQYITAFVDTGALPF
jgi:hypothetical protein